MAERQLVRWAAPALFVVLALLAWCRPADHDESQYVAAAMLAGRGLVPYRDFAYLQPPLQPLALGWLATLAGGWAWPALRIANALFGTLSVATTYEAARAGGVRPHLALATAGLFAACDALLFSAGTARNDALPVACLAGAIWLAVRLDAGPVRRRPAEPLAIGLLLAAAACAKLSYLLPAAACGVAALAASRRWRPGLMVIGALPPVALAWGAWHAAPEAFAFDVWRFPVDAPAQWYAGSAKMTLPGRAADLLKFLALGPALMALATRVARPARWTWLDGMIVAGLLAALLPAPTWRQYLLPLLPPLFVRLALLWEERPPTPALRWPAAIFAAAGLAPSVAAIVAGGGMGAAMAQGATIRAAMDAHGVTGPVATLSPEYLPATRRWPDTRFAAGPFAFRTRALLSPEGEARARFVSAGNLDTGLAVRPDAVLAGGEALTSGDPALDAALERWAAAHGYRRVGAGAFRLWVTPRVRLPGR